MTSFGADYLLTSPMPASCDPPCFFGRSGVRVLTADALCIRIAVAVQRKQPALPMRMPPHIAFFLPRSCRKTTTSVPILPSNTEYEIALHSHRRQVVRWRGAWSAGHFQYFTTTLCHTAESYPDPSAMYLDVVPPSTLR